MDWENIRSQPAPLIPELIKEDLEIEETSPERRKKKNEIDKLDKILNISSSNGTSSMKNIGIENLIRTDLIVDEDEKRVDMLLKNKDKKEL